MGMRTLSIRVLAIASSWQLYRVMRAKLLAQRSLEVVLQLSHDRCYPAPRCHAGRSFNYVGHKKGPAGSLRFRTLLRNWIPISEPFAACCNAIRCASNAFA